MANVRDTVGNSASYFWISVLWMFYGKLWSKIWWETKQHVGVYWRIKLLDLAMNPDVIDKSVVEHYAAHPL